MPQVKEFSAVHSAQVSQSTTITAITNWAQGGGGVVVVCNWSFIKALYGGVLMLHTAGS